ncbi:reverse transcriptase domain-containing protein [Tanacetum coccineum]
MAKDSCGGSYFASKDFDIEYSRTKKGAENLAAGSFWSRLETPHQDKLEEQKKSMKGGAFPLSEILLVLLLFKIKVPHGCCILQNYHAGKWKFRYQGNDILKQKNKFFKDGRFRHSLQGLAQWTHLAGHYWCQVHSNEKFSIQDSIGSTIYKDAHDFVTRSWTFVNGKENVCKRDELPQNSIQCFAKSFWTSGALILLGPFPSSRWEQVHTRGAVDYLSKWVEAKALPTNDARVVCKFLKTLFSRFGAPRAIISDRGTHFCNDQFTKVMLKYGVTHRLSTAYHPQTSGIGDQYNQPEVVPDRRRSHGPNKFAPRDGSSVNGPLTSDSLGGHPMLISMALCIVWSRDCPVIAEVLLGACSIHMSFTS